MNGQSISKISILPWAQGHHHMMTHIIVYDFKDHVDHGNDVAFIIIWSLDSLGSV